MGSELNSFVMLAAAVLILLSLIAAGVAVAGSVLYGSTQRRKEVATRRILDQRRSHIARMFLSENVLAIAAGIAIGGVAMLVAGESRHPWFLTIASSSAVLLLVAGLFGGWLAGRRHAAKVPFSASGLFRTSSDSRGHS